MKYIIEGQKKLYGTVSINAAKNSVLPLMAASIMCDGKTEFSNVPKITDVENMQHVLKSVGCHSRLHQKRLTIDAQNPKNTFTQSDAFGKIRSSFFVLGAMLARMRKAEIAFPGGCAIGKRPVDIHLAGLRAMGVKILESEGRLFCDATNMHASKIRLRFPSVGATENLMMAATLQKGTTTIKNAAREPEIVDLANYLNLAGARICGAGTKTITIEGVKRLHSIAFTPIFDRIEAGTYLIATAACGGEILLKNFCKQHNQALLDILYSMGCAFRCTDDTISIVSYGRLNSNLRVKTQPYCGFPTDLQAQLMALFALSNGKSTIIENLFETRFCHAQELIKMGAQIKIHNNKAQIVGQNLQAAKLSAHDLRGGAALTIALCASNGTGELDGIHFIERGYEGLDTTLNNLGAKIQKQ